MGVYNGGGYLVFYLPAIRPSSLYESRFLLWACHPCCAWKAKGGMGLGCEPRSPAEAGGARRCSAQTRREFAARAFDDDNIMAFGTESQWLSSVMGGSGRTGVRDEQFVWEDVQDYNVGRIARTGGGGDG